MELQNLTPQPAGGAGRCGNGAHRRPGFRFARLLLVVAVAAAVGFAGSYASKSFDCRTIKTDTFTKGTL